MIWAVGIGFALGLALCAFAGVLAMSDQPPDSAWPIYVAMGLALLSASCVLAIGNAAVEALL